MGEAGIAAPGGAKRCTPWTRPRTPGYSGRPPCEARRRRLRALIVEHGLNRAALAGARALRRAGWSVGVGAPTRGLAAWSRACDRWHPIPAPQHGVKEFIEATNVAIADGGYEIVFGCDDAEVLALSQGRGQLGALVPHADHDTVARALDKLELASAARRAGLATPTTVEAGEAALLELAPPVVVKPRRSAAIGRDVASARMEAGIAHTREDATRRASEIRAAGGEPLIQELAAVADGDSRVVSSVQQEADRLWPPEAGGTVRATSVAIDPELERATAALLAQIGWFGLAQLQFVVPGDGVPRLIDFNGRFYGSLELALAAGPNLPAIWAALATGRSPGEWCTPARAGIRYQWLEGDLRRAAAERGGVARDVLGSLRYATRAKDSILSAADPWPGVRYAGLLARRALRKGARLASPRGGLRFSGPPGTGGAPA